MKTQRRYTILAVDDDEINLMILTKCVSEAGYSVMSFESGKEAWEYLSANPKSIDVALLDKMMPEMSGMDILKRMKDSDQLRHIPVIIQTGDAGVTQMREGLESGAYYYLTKPFHPNILAAILNSATTECAVREELRNQASADHAKFMWLMQDGEFTIKTHAEASVLAATLSQASLYPEFVAVGLMELLSNAIEHGNLEMGYQIKNKSISANRLSEELANRTANPIYGLRVVHVHIEKTPSGLHIAIRDEGKGFDVDKFTQQEPGGHLEEPNGRGIAKAIIMLDDVRYNANGNEVHCNISMAPPKFVGDVAIGISASSRNN